MEIKRNEKISIFSLMGRTMQSIDQLEAIYEKLEKMVEDGQPDTSGILADLRQAKMHLRIASEYITNLKLTR